MTLNNHTKNSQIKYQNVSLIKSLNMKIYTVLSF